MLAVLWGTVCPGDELRLADGADRLTGRVVRIDRGGVVELSSELSADPIRLKPDAVETVSFEHSGEVPAAGDARVELRNGDVFPVSVTGLEEDSLGVVLGASGGLEIPRSALSSLQLGVRPGEVLYAGPGSLDEWIREGPERENWEYRRGRLLAQGETWATKSFELPAGFVVRFTLEWEEKTVPNIEVLVADPRPGPGVAGDRYRLKFGGSGLEVIREAAKGKRDNKLLVLNRTPNRYHDRKLRVELRVDRRTGRIGLSLNGEPEGEPRVDPIPSIPTGSAVTFACNTPNDGVLEISGIEVARLDDTHRRHWKEERGDAGRDYLFSRDDDRWGGRLLDSVEKEGGRFFRFESDFREGVMEVPFSEVSTLFFASGEDDGGEDSGGPWVLRLRGGGVLRVKGCEFGEDEVIAEHPLLGQLRFSRDGIERLERMTEKSNKEEK